MKRKLYKGVPFGIRMKIRFFDLVYRLTKKRIIVDITGVILNPSKNGEKCRGNGEHFDIFGRKIDCCCDECDYLAYCFAEYCETIGRHKTPYVIKKRQNDKKSV